MIEKAASRTLWPLALNVSIDGLIKRCGGVQNKTEVIYHLPVAALNNSRKV